MRSQQLLNADDRHVAVFVDPSDVAGDEEAIGPELGRGTRTFGGRSSPGTSKQDKGITERFIAAVRRLSQICGIISVALLLASVLAICRLVFVRHALGESAIWQHEFFTFSLIAGFFLPPVAVILMSAPTLVPIVEAAGLDLI